MTGTPKLRLDNVTKRFPIRGSKEEFTAVEDISLDLSSTISTPS